jgi:hypothetical protein
VAGPGDLFDLAGQLLEACQDALEFAPAGPIDYAFISPGPPAWDAVPMLAVYAGSAAEADTAPLQPPLQPSHRIDAVGVVPMVTLTAVVLRPAPTLADDGQVPVAPPPAEITMVARDTLGDLWAIWNYLASRKRDGTLWPPHTREFLFDPAVPVNQQGGAAGWQIQLKVHLGGYVA